MASCFTQYPSHCWIIHSLNYSTKRYLFFPWVFNLCQQWLCSNINETCPLTKTSSIAAGTGVELKRPKWAMALSQQFTAAKRTCLRASGDMEDFSYLLGGWHGLSLMYFWCGFLECWIMNCTVILRFYVYFQVMHVIVSSLNSSSQLFYAVARLA